MALRIRQICCGRDELDKTSKNNTVILPDEIDTISEGAFKEDENLKHFICNKELLTIQNEAFESSGLVDIKLNEGVETIGSYAFYDTPLEKIEFQKGLYEIGESAFEDCTNLKSAIFNQRWMETICIDAFKNCPSITSLKLPFVMDIEQSAFENCTNLKTLIISTTNSPKSYSNYKMHIRNNAFKCCDNLETIVLDILPTQNLKVDAFAFAACKNIKNIYVRNEILEDKDFEEFKQLANDTFGPNINILSLDTLPLDILIEVCGTVKQANNFLNERMER